VTNEISLLKCKYDGSVKREWAGELVDLISDWVVIAHLAGVHRHLKYGQRVTGDIGARCST
jgi:hypothetical protein